MPEQVTLTIDERKVSVPEGTTILKAAESLGIKIPTNCYHDYLTANGLCRLCVVEVEGARVLPASCVAKVSEGMVVHTQTERVRKSRRTILEMLASTLDLSESPDLQEYIQEYDADPQRFPMAEKRQPEVIDDNPMYIRDYAKCVLCWRCVQICAKDAQYTFALNFRNRGFHTQITTYYQKPLTESTCVFCGQCVSVCPSGALKPKREWLTEQGYTPEEVMELTRPQRSKKTLSVQQDQEMNR
jgi:NADH dehydrogenase/NADH:ubiquinone oxidoreductase subunit G